MKMLAIAAALLALNMETAAAMTTTTTTTDAAPTTKGQPGSFDRAAWVAVAGKADRSEPRFAMIDAAIAQIPPGTAQDDVRARLGEPDQSFPDSWAYMAGPTLFGGEYTAVLVRFDADGRVVDARKVSSETWN